MSEQHLPKILRLSDNKLLSYSCPSGKFTLTDLKVFLALDVAWRQHGKHKKMNISAEDILQILKQSSDPKSIKQITDSFDNLVHSSFIIYGYEENPNGETKVLSTEIIRIMEHVSFQEPMESSRWNVSLGPHTVNLFQSNDLFTYIILMADDLLFGPPIAVLQFLFSSVDEIKNGFLEVPYDHVVLEYVFEESEITEEDYKELDKAAAALVATGFLQGYRMNTPDEKHIQFKLEPWFDNILINLDWFGHLE